MAKLKILVCKTFRSVDSRGPSTISVDKVSSLNHELLNDAMELATFVALRSSALVFRFSSAVLTEVLGSTRDDIREELHLDSTKWLAAECYIKEDHRVGLSSHPGCVLPGLQNLVLIGLFEWSCGRVGVGSEENVG